MILNVESKLEVEALFISDIHLGSKGCNAEALLNTLKQYQPKQLFIVGDFIDGWLLKKRHYWPQSHTNLIRKILSYSKKGTEVIYVTGNHDEFLRNYAPLEFANIRIVNEAKFKNWWVVHGDAYDGVVKMSKLLAIGGSVGYELAIWFDRNLNKIRRKLKIRPKSLSKWLKDSVKNVVVFITSFESQLQYQAEKRKCKGVICGHIHTPIIKENYINCGDWIENNSYIIYNDNKFTLKFSQHGTHHNPSN